MDFRRIWIAVFFVAFTFFLLSSSHGRTRSWNPVEQLLVELTAPFQKFIRQTILSTKSIWLDYFELVNVQQENRELLEEIDALRIENSRLKESLSTHERLRGLLQFTETTNWPVLAAQVTGRDPTGWFRSIIIDKGKGDGLETDMPVVSAQGVVGRVVSVSPHYAKVLLIIDHNSAVDCLVQRSRDRGMIKGMSTELCKLDYMVETTDVAIGDILITSGLGGVYPKGLPVGRVLRVEEIPGDLFKSIEIRPSVDFSKLEEVLVILKENKALSHQKEDS